MKVTESRGFRDITLYVSGKIDATTSPQLHMEIFRALKINKVLVLDFLGVEAIDPLGIQVLQSGMRAAISNRGSMKIQNAKAKVKGMLQKEGLGKLLMI